MRKLSRTDFQMIELKSKIKYLFDKNNKSFLKNILNKENLSNNIKKVKINDLS